MTASKQDAALWVTVSPHSTEGGYNVFRQMPPTWLRLGLVGALALAGCEPATQTPTPSTVPHGGTLRVVVPNTEGLPPGYMPPDKTTIDVLSATSSSDAFELLRCCLGRTLLSYNGQPTSSGGATLRPDLASGPPDVASDGLTWTFHLRQHLHYAPPLAATEITAADIVRAMRRTARLDGLPPFYSAIAGFDDYAAGTTESIAGLETPDTHTLVVRLTRPQGDFGYRISLYNVAPLPPLPSDPSAPFGVASGHDDGDSGFLVSSGPYMLEGADKVDFSLASAQQAGASGLVEGKSITLVRNPSWHSGDDPLRPAYADRIVVTYGGSVAGAIAAVDAGQQDIILTLTRPPQVPAIEVAAWEANPGRGHVDIEPRDGVRYVSMNLATPPFDDLHVRRAVAFAIDRKKLEDAFGGALTGSVTGHLALDSMEDNALINYDPYRAADATTRLQMAKQEIAQSKYDSAHAGMCDAVACQHVVALALVSPQTPTTMADAVRADLAQIGIHLDVTSASGQPYFRQLGDPTKDPAMGMFWGFGKDYPNGADFFVQLFSKDAIGAHQDYTLVGASPDQLRQWGYAVNSVPAVDDRIAQCLPLVGDAQTHCWTSLDQHMIEKVAAVVPFAAETYTELVPKRIVNYSYDQYVTFPALDRIALQP
jgi:peptide/nickel transport system substrate-binding protein